MSRLLLTCARIVAFCSAVSLVLALTAGDGREDRVLEAGHRFALGLGDIGQRLARLQLGAQFGLGQAEVAGGG
ncbi:MAG: hypothetical protein ACM3ML_09140 [Micromonosporaceae bacterium]